MRNLRLLVPALVLLVFGTVLGFVFRGEISRICVECVGLHLIQLVTITPVDAIFVSYRLALGVGVLSCSPVMGMWIAGPARTWRLGLVFLLLAVGVSLGMAWLVVSDFQQTLAEGPSNVMSSTFYSTATLGRIFLSGPVAVWVVALAIRFVKRLPKRIAR